jgi:hypothetical protein
VPIGVVLPGAKWNPSLPMLAASAVAGALSGGGAPLSLRFTALAGSWHVDDVFVDRYRRG